MASVNSYSAAGVKSGAKANLDKNIFGVEVKSHGLLKSAYEVFLANGRVNLAKTKTRGEVVGSTKKPWKQKGTGRARFGSKYNPIWRGGGITFGPTGQENYSKKLNTKAKHLALKQALTLSANEGKVKVIDSFVSKDGKVKPTVKLLEKVEATGRVIILVENKDALTARSVNNIDRVKVSEVKYLNVFDVMNADTVIISKKALDIISDWLSPKTVKKPEAK